MPAAPVTAVTPPDLKPLPSAFARHAQARDWPAALAVALEGLDHFPQDPHWHISSAQCLLALGRRREAREALRAARRVAPAEPVLLDALGGLFNQADDQAAALEAYDAALALAPDHPHCLFNRATVLRFLGRLAEAERDYDRVIALKADDHEAYKNRTELRTQTPAHNHVHELEQVLARGIEDWRGHTQIRYALAKEYEDLGEHARSFVHLQAGAHTRRQHLRYDAATDLATVDWIIEAFPGNAPVPPAPGEGPIFIVGLPRSGTTLVDRILGSHSSLHSAGELDHFATSLVAAVRRRHPAPLSRRELVARSAQVDFEALGHAYLERADAALDAPGRFTDKMPLNYLYCGLIRRALPQARIVHLTRHPMAACYAMYKTLFKDAYPFSYDLEEIGRYYLGYRRLMQHWQSSMPGVIHEVSYEALVDDQAGETARLLDHCGLEWQDACVDFHLNAAPTTTASAVQVRRPLYRTSLSQWRHYARELAPLARLLGDAGLDTR